MANQLTRYATVATVDTAGEGGFWGVTVHVPNIAPTSVVIDSSANRVRVYQFVLPFRAKVANITLEVTTLEVGKFIGVGIYHADKSIALQGKVSTTTTGIKTVAITSVTLEPGVYWHAKTADGTTVKAKHINLGVDYANASNEITVKIGNAANSSTAGVLPATLGTITANTQVPIAAFFEP